MPLTQQSPKRTARDEPGTDISSETSTRQYLLWGDASSEALIIDPADEDIELYLRLLKAKVSSSVCAGYAIHADHHRGRRSSKTGAVGEACWGHDLRKMFRSRPRRIAVFVAFMAAFVTYQEAGVLAGVLTGAAAGSITCKGTFDAFVPGGCEGTFLPLTGSKIAECTDHPFNVFRLDSRPREPNRSRFSLAHRLEYRIPVISGG